MENQVSTERKMLEHQEITRDNSLITARYKASLTENKMTVLALKRSTFDEHGRHVASFTASELKSIMKHDNGSFYQQLKDTAKKMQNRQLAIEDLETKKFKFMSIIDTAEFNNGVFTVSFNPDVNKYIDNLKKNFTIMNMGILVDFTSTYAYRMYEILKSQEYLIDLRGDERGEYCISYSVSELKVAVGCVDTSTPAVQQELGRKTPNYDKIVEELATDKHFDKWYDFKKNVLDVAEKQINEKSDLCMRYELNRSGRGGKVQGVRIFIRHNPDYVDGHVKEPEIQIDENISVVGQNQNIIRRLSEIIDYIQEYPVSVEEANLFLKKANFNVERVKDAYDYVLTKKKVKDFVGYMVDAITNGYAKPAESRSIGKNTSYLHHLRVEDNNQISFADLEYEEKAKSQSGGKADKFEEVGETSSQEGNVGNSSGNHIGKYTGNSIENSKKSSEKPGGKIAVETNVEVGLDDAMQEDKEEQEVNQTSGVKKTERGENEELTQEAAADSMAMELISGMSEDPKWKEFIGQLELPYELILQVKGAKWLIWKYADWKKRTNEEG